MNMKKFDNFMANAYPLLFIGISILLDRTALSPVKPIDALLWIVPAVCGSYFLYRLLYCSFVEKKFSYRFLFIVLVSIFIIVLYALTPALRIAITS